MKTHEKKEAVGRKYEPNTKAKTLLSRYLQPHSCQSLSVIFWAFNIFEKARQKSYASVVGLSETVFEVLRSKMNFDESPA